MRRNLPQMPARPRSAGATTDTARPGRAATRASSAKTRLVLRALANRNYRLWAAADLVSVTGSWMQVLGMNWVVLARTGSPTAVGFSVLLSSVPALLLGPWAGALADRFPPRGMILLGESLHLVIAVLLAALVWSQAPLAGIYALTALGGLVSTLEGPALGRFAGQVVPPADLGNALAWNSVTNSAGRVLGMSLAGVLAASSGNAPLFLFNAGTFVVVIVTVLRMRTEEFHSLAVSPSDQIGVRAGLAYLRGRRALLVLFALGFVLSSLGRNYQVTIAAMTQGPLGGGPGQYGALSSVFAAGTVLGGIVATRFTELTIPLLLGSAALTSVLQAVSGFAPGVASFGALIVPIAAGAVVIDTAKGTRLQLDSAEGMRGRVLAINATVGAAAGAVGAPLLGWLCARLGPREALLVAGLITLLATVAAAAALRPRHEAAAMTVAEV